MSIPVTLDEAVRAEFSVLIANTKEDHLRGRIVARLWSKNKSVQEIKKLMDILREWTYDEMLGFLEEHSKEV